MENDGKDPGQVFRIPDLWGASSLLKLQKGPDSFLFSGLNLADVSNELPAIADIAPQSNSFFGIPDPELLELVPSIEPYVSDHPIDCVDAPEYQEVSEDRDSDVWLCEEEALGQEPGKPSWDIFEDPRLEKQHNPYITEAGASVFDAAVASELDYLRIANSDYAVVDTKIYVSSMLALGLGRSSVFFVWDVDKVSFKPELPHMRVSGFSGEALEALVTPFFESGNITRSLRDFVEQCYTKCHSPGQIALAEAISTLLVSIQSHLSVSAYESILQLQALFEPVKTILTSFHRIVKTVSTTRNDEAMLSTIFQEVQLLEHQTGALRVVLLELLSQVSQPWLEFSSEWLGLQIETGPPLSKDGKGKGFVKAENREWVDDKGTELQESDFSLDYDKIPSFFAPEDARLMFETGKSLRFLRSHHSDHPLSSADFIAGANPPLLDWKFSWQNILHVQQRALQYEKDLTLALQLFGKEQIPTVHYSRPQLEIGALETGYAEDPHAFFLSSVESFNKPLPKVAFQDRIGTSLNKYLSSKMEETVHHGGALFTPPISLVPALSFNPIISAQARIVNGTCMGLFFNAHKLRYHLALQKDFHLLGNGVFSSRLSHALFDPELESAERKRGVARSGGVMGLRLGGRDTWPPASSELRLALMGVLNESYSATKATQRLPTSSFLDQTALLGDLSFAVRDMTESEIEKCMDPNSNEALDFLRLSYQPPAPLDAIITPMILFKYDQVFKFLLRLLRMLYIVSTISRDTKNRFSQGQYANSYARLFCVEAHHFVTNISRYFFDTGIEVVWAMFERKLDQVEAKINSKDESSIFGQNEGLDRLRDYHERVLDKIMFSLFLRKRQQPVMHLIEELFALILQFSAKLRQKAHDDNSGSGGEDKIQDLHTKFRKKAGVFITVCRGLSEKKGYGESKAIDGQGSVQGGLFDYHELTEENTVPQLLARLEMSNYYSRIVGT